MRLLTVIASVALCAMVAVYMYKTRPGIAKVVSRTGPVAGWDLARNTFVQSAWTHQNPTAGTATVYQLTLFGASPRIREPWTSLRPGNDTIQVSHAGETLHLPFREGTAWRRPDGSWRHSTTRFPELSALAGVSTGDPDAALFDVLRERFPEQRALLDEIEGDLTASVGTDSRP